MATPIEILSRSLGPQVAALAAPPTPPVQVPQQIQQEPVTIAQQLRDAIQLPSTNALAGSFRSLPQNRAAESSPQESGTARDQTSLPLVERAGFLQSLAPKGQGDQNVDASMLVRILLRLLTGA